MGGFERLPELNHGSVGAIPALPKRSPHRPSDPGAVRGMPALSERFWHCLSDPWTRARSIGDCG